MASIQEETSPMESVKEEPADASSRPGNPSLSGETSHSDASSVLVEDDVQQDASLQESTSGDGPVENVEMYSVSLCPYTNKERERARRKSIREKTFLSLPGLLIFREFCLEMNVSMDVKKMNINQMVANLQKFFFFVRVKPGAVLQQLFEQISIVVEAMRGINIRKDARFKKVVRVCRGRINSFDHIRCHSPQITEQLSMFCLRKLLLSVDVRPNHPTGLFNLTLLYMVVYMCKGTTHWTELKALLVSMRKSSFVCKRDKTKGLKFITIRNEPQCTAGRFYEIPGHPVCPFKIFRLFMSKLSVSSNYLWQRPKAHSKINECWFHPDACNTINNDWLLDLTEKASMTVSYTNMSLVLTPRSVMDSTLADPVFTKSYANEVKEIPEPPTFDPSNLDSVLPGGNDKLEIKLLNSSEAQVEIRLTDILWKELFPEWDRTRLESGYQNHVDFMKHLLEVHKTCKDGTCFNQENCMKESIEGENITSEHVPQNTPTSSMVTTIPINVAPQGIQNSSLLTVVNNNTVPQNAQGAQNFIVPLNTLLESLASTSQSGVPLASSSAVTSVADTSSLLQNTAALPVHVDRGGPEKTDLPISQNNSNLHQLAGSSNTVILPSVVSNPVLPLSTVTTSTPSQPVADAGSSELLAGKNVIQSLLVDNATKLSPGLQSVSLQGLPLPILESIQNGTNGVSPAGGPNTTSLQNNTLNVQPIPGLSGNLQTAGPQTLLTNGLPNLATPGLQNIVTSGGSLPALKHMIPLIESHIVPTSGMNGFQQSDPVSKQSSPILQGAQIPGQQVITSSNGCTNTALLTNRINTFAEQLTSSNAAGSTFVITNHGIIAVPNIQQSPQTVVVSGPDLNDTSSVSTVGVSPLANITESETLGRNDGIDLSSAVPLVTHCQDNFTEEGGESFLHDDYNHELPVKALDYSTKSHVSDTQCNSEEMEEAPLDLSVGKPKRKLQLTQTSALTSLVPPLPIVDEPQVIGIKHRVEESQVVVPHNNNTWSGASTATSSGRKPPPPYPGVTQKVLATQAISQIGYPRFVREPTKDYPGFMKMTLKRKSSTGKSVRELLDKKRKNDLAKAGHASHIADSMAVRTLATFPPKLGIGVDSFRHKSGDRARKKVKIERAGNDMSNSGSSKGDINIPTASSAATTGVHHSLITLAAFHKREMGECASENGQPDLNDSTQVESVDEKYDLSESKCSPSLVKGCRPGRKSRRKPQQVFKRNLAEDLDVIEEIEGFS